MCNFFDVYKNGTIDTKDTVKTMIEIGFEDKNPELFKMMNDLQDLGNTVDWPTFAWHVVKRITDKDSKQGLRTIFNLYVDDTDDKTISLDSLKLICKRLNENKCKKEVDKLLDGPGSKSRLTFDEFYEFMKNRENDDEE